MSQMSHCMESTIMAEIGPKEEREVPVGIDGKTNKEVDSREEAIAENTATIENIMKPMEE